MKNPKQDLLLHIIHTLYSKAYEVLQENLNQIIHAQHGLETNSQNGFWYKGKHWGATGRKAKPLHDSLKSKMDSYIKSSADLEIEVQYVKSYLQCILNNCTELGFLYHYLPTGLHTVLRNRGITQNNESPPVIEHLIMYNQKGKELLITRLMLNMTGV